MKARTVSRIVWGKTNVRAHTTAVEVVEKIADVPQAI